MVRCIVMFLLRWENFTSISFRGFKERCQYLHEGNVIKYQLMQWMKSNPPPRWGGRNRVRKFPCHTHLHVPTGLGSTTPAVYTAWKIPCRLTRLVISLISTGATRLERSFLWTQRKLISTIFFSLKQKKSNHETFIYLNNTLNTIY